MPEAIIAEGFGDQKDAEDAGLKSTVDSRVIPGCGNKGKYQGTKLVWMVLGRYWGEEWGRKAGSSQGDEIAGM